MTLTIHRPAARDRVHGALARLFDRPAPAAPQTVFTMDEIREQADDPPEVPDLHRAIELVDLPDPKHITY